MSETNETKYSITQLRELAKTHNLSVRPHAVDTSPRSIVRKGGGPSLAFDSAMDYIWQFAGNTKDVVAFLGAAGMVARAYFKSKGARVIRISDCKHTVEIKGGGDIQSAIDAFNATEKKNLNFLLPPAFHSAMP